MINEVVSRVMMNDDVLILSYFLFWKLVCIYICVVVTNMKVLYY